MNRDISYEARILSTTNRSIELRMVKCLMCESGSSMWETVCTNCCGEGEVQGYVYSDCSHRVEGDECIEEGCEEVLKDAAKNSRYAA